MRIVRELLIVAAAATPLAAQESGVADQGTFTISQAGSVIGREEFVIRRGRTGAPQDGFTISSTVSYPPEQSTRTVAVKVEVSGDSLPVLAEIHYRAGDRRAVLVGLGPRRVTVRSVTPTGESMREYPARPRTLVTEERAFAPYAILPGMGGGAISELAPMAERRAQLQLTDHGIERIRVKGVERPLRHVSLAGEGGTRHLWYDERGRLVQVTDPARGIHAVRDGS